MTSPIYPITSLNDQGRVCAAFTGRGSSSSHNRHFSFHWPPRISSPRLEADTTTTTTHPFTKNLQHVASQLGFDPRSVTWPNGGWPHTGKVIIAEDPSLKWVTNPQTGGIMPVAASESVNDDRQSTSPKAVSYDGIVTRSPDYVLAVQGADCPSIFLYASESGLIGVVHAGWKPLIRGVVGNAIAAMVKGCGARPEEIVAYIGPGAGDRYTQFRWDGEMESYVRDVFVQAGREDLLESHAVRHEMTVEDRRELSSALGKEVQPGFSFRISALAVRELVRNRVKLENIRCHEGSTIVDAYPETETETAGAFKYHSYRRDRPNHGLSLGVLFLKSTSTSGPENFTG